MHAGRIIASAVALCALAPGCATGPPLDGAFHYVGLDWSSVEIERLDAGLRRLAYRDLGQEGGERALRVLRAGLSDPDPGAAAVAAHALAVTGDPRAPGTILGWLPEDAPPAVVSAAALGLGYSQATDAERVLAALARRDPAPPEAPEALFSYYRWSGHPAPATLPDDAFLAYAHHTEARGRAALGHLARAVKDPRLVAPLAALTGDDDPEVRRAAAMGLARSEATPWPDEDAAFAPLPTLLKDGDRRVVAAACRALSSYDRPAALAALRTALDHGDFNVRATAIQGLVRREAKDSYAAIARLATEDASVFVRGTAGSAVATLDSVAAQDLAERLLSDPAEFVRASGCEILAAVAEGPAREAAEVRLSGLSASDPHVRVREAALDAFKGWKGDVVTAVLRRALESDLDPVVVAVACDVAQTNGLDELLSAVRAVPRRFAGMRNADAREGALGALAKWAREEDRALFERHVGDAHPSVAWTAERGLAALAGLAAPEATRHGVRGAGAADMANVPPEIDLVVETSRGTMVFRLLRDLAPRHVSHVVACAQRGVYDGLTWHRVVADFVIQGGCPRGDGAGAAGVSLPLEPTSLPFERGVLGMPRSSHPDSGGCQLFVMHSRAPHLDLHYTAFGYLVAGDEVIDAIDVDDTILGARVEAVARE